MSYNRDIRPILTENCFACHGPDKNKRVAGLRLDVREDALARGLFVPGRPAQSKLVARVFTTDAGRRMPPASTHKQLTSEQKGLLKRWVAQGAKYEPHWAFVPLPARVALPPVKNAAWCRNPLDRFVLSRLEQEGLRPSPEADPPTLIRRVTLDLTGLPPTPEEVAAFVRACAADQGIHHRGTETQRQPERENPAEERGGRRSSDALRPKGSIPTPNPPTSRVPEHPTPRGRAHTPTPPYSHTPPQNALSSTIDRAYERLIDRLLASPRYGERMAVPWLDVARYADSYGYQSDQLCPTWPYRDWVVRAFNADMPYDEFLREQLAGDLLPNASRETRVATAFNRLHRMTNEGGSVPEEWRLEGVADRVNTFGTAFLGLTTECARCHDHKYDPIAQKDYYALSAFFNNIDEHGLYDRADIVPSPSLLLPTAEQEKELSATKEAVRQAEAALAQARIDGDARFREWLVQGSGFRVQGSGPRADPRTVRTASSQDGSPPTPNTQHPTPIPDLTGFFDFEAFDGATLKNRAPGATQHGGRIDEVPLVEGHSGKAAQLDGDNGVNFPALGKFQRHTPFTVAFWMRDAGLASEPAVVFQGCDGTDTGPHGYDLVLERGLLSARMFRHWPGNAIGIRTRQPIPKNTWTHVAVTYDGSSRAGGLRIFLNGHAAETEVLRDHLQKGTGVHTLIFGQRFRDKGFKGGRIDELALFNRSLTSAEVAQLFDGRGVAAALADPTQHEAELREYYFSAIDAECRKAAEALAAARARVVAAEDAQLEIAVMEEMPQPRPAYVLSRGQYDAPKTDANRVERGVPEAVFPYPAGGRRDRLGLAEWLTQPRHPLTARVAVNRVWALLFGRGLVETVENFGLQGRMPTHPALFDWLAAAFVSAPTSGRQGMGERVNGGKGDSSVRAVSHSPTLPLSHSSPREADASGYECNWSVKKLIKLIVTSATYRQASALRPELKQRDPENRLLARGPSRRLSAESVRDLALAASGLLDERMGGPPVSPYQPGDLWREVNTMSPPYRQSTGTDLYRRSLYSVRKRTSPMPNMLAFDSPTREVCVARRQVTNTPLQALVLMNDPQFVEAARVLAERTLKEGGTTNEERVRFAFRRLAGREPDAEERQLLTRLYAEQRELFAKRAAEAAKLLTIGERKPDPALPPAEVAAATVLTQTILNLDATIWER